MEMHLMDSKLEVICQMMIGNQYKNPFWKPNSGRLKPQYGEK